MNIKPMEILTYGNNILKKAASPVTEIDEDLLNLIKAMSLTMKAASGVGLAAPQVGVSKRVIVFITHPEDTKVLAIINPEIISSEGEMIAEEGCLSLPGITGEVKRYASVVVKGLDKKGKPVQIEGIGLLSRILQHEIDHLNGILFIDHLSFVRRQLVSKKLKQLKKENLAASLPS